MQFRTPTDASDAKSINRFAKQVNGNVLTLNNIVIEVKDVPEIMELLNQRPDITTLDMGDNKSFAALEAVFILLKDNRTLISLYLGGTDLHNEGMRFLADALKDNRTLTSLDLHFSMTMGRDVQFLAKALKEESDADFT